MGAKFNLENSKVEPFLWFGAEFFHKIDQTSEKV